MLRREQLCDQEEQSYHRQLNKEKVYIRRYQRENTFNRKRNNFIPTHYLSLQRINKQKQIEEQNQTSSQAKQVTQVHEPIFILDQRYSDQIKQANKCDFPQQIGVFIQLIKSDVTLSVICGTIGLRRILSESQAYIQKVIDADLVDNFIQLTHYQNSPQVQLEATWCIANIAAGSTAHCQTLINKGAIPLLVQIVKERNHGIMEQAVWAIGNIASDCSPFRNMLLEAGAGQAISDLILRQEVGQQFKVECCWTLSNLCRGQPLPNYQKIKNPLRIICSMVALGSIQPVSIFIDCCWAISYHYTGKNDRARDALDFNLLQRIVPRALQTKNINLLMPIVRIVGQLSIGGFDYTDQIIKKGGLDLLQKCILHKKVLLRREAAWILSNLTASPYLEHIQHILARDTIMIKMMDMFVHDTEDIRKEVAFFFSNMCYGGKTLNLEQVFVEQQLISCYVELLKSENTKVILNGLETLNNILRFTEQKKKSKDSVNVIASELVRNGGVHIIQKLQDNPDENIYHNAHSILVNYYQIIDPLDNEMSHFSKKIQQNDEPQIQ